MCCHLIRSLVAQKGQGFPVNHEYSTVEGVRRIFRNSILELNVFPRRENVHLFSSECNMYKRVEPYRLSFTRVCCSCEDDDFYLFFIWAVSSNVDSTSQGLPSQKRSIWQFYSYDCITLVLIGGLVFKFYLFTFTIRQPSYQSFAGF